MKDIRMINGEFESASPESVGISSADVASCLEAIKQTGLNMHSFHIFRNGYLIAGGCAAPFSLSMKRRVYSVMKSVTALAVDFSIQEGKLSLDDAIIDHYPEVKCADRDDPRLKKLTIRDTLMMAVGHERDAQREYDQLRFGIGAIPKTYRNGDQPDLSGLEGKTLKELFFSLPFEKEPGTEFFYDNTVPEIVGMLAENASGESYYDYLRPRLFEPLGIEFCKCNRIEEYDGSDRNFSATTVMTLRDMLKFGLFYLQHGSWEGKQILRADIIEDGAKKHMDTKDFVLAHADHGFSPDADVFGYGYQMWMNRYGGYSLVGGACQTCICIPDKDMMVSFTCFDRRESSTPELCVPEIIYREVVSKVQDGPLPEDEFAYKKMAEAFDAWSTAPVLKDCPDVRPDEASGTVEPGKEYKVLKNDLGIRTFRLIDGENKAEFGFEDGKRVELSYGTGGRFVENSKGLGHDTDGYSTIYFTDPEEVYASGGWDGSDFVLNLHYTAQMNNYNCVFRQEGGAVKIEY